MSRTFTTMNKRSEEVNRGRDEGGLSIVNDSTIQTNHAIMVMQKEEDTTYIKNLLNRGNSPIRGLNL